MCKLDTPASMVVSHGREVLPTNVRPTHYDLSLEPDLEAFTYTGSVVIDLDVLEDTSSITLNTIDITVKHAKLRTGTTADTKTLAVEQDEDAQTSTFKLNESLPGGGSAQLHIDFSGCVSAMIFHLHVVLRSRR